MLQNKAYSAVLGPYLVNILALYVTVGVGVSKRNPKDGFFRVLFCSVTVKASRRNRRRDADAATRRRFDEKVAAAAAYYTILPHKICHLLQETSCG